MSIETGSNCIGYAYFILGLQSVEKGIQIGLFSETLERFQVVPEKNEAVAVAITIGKNNEEVVVHMALLDQETRAFIVERKAEGAPVSITSYTELLNRYSHPRYKVRLLNVKVDQ